MWTERMGLGVSDPGWNAVALKRLGSEMAKYRFKQAEKHAVFSVHGSKCYIDHEALTMKTVEIDHIIPESLRDEPERLTEVLAELGRPTDFDVNSYENWLPVCHRCNLDKRATAWDASGFSQSCLQRAEDRADYAREVAEKLVTDQSLAKAVAVLEAADESGVLTWETLENLAPLVEQLIEDRPPDEAEEPVLVNEQVEFGRFELLGDNGSTAIARGPYGVGGAPSGPVAAHMRCSACGNAYFEGARCIMCGSMDDD